MSLDAAVELVALGLAAWAAWLSLPRPPEHDGERLFKVILATLIRGEVEAAGGDRDDWARRLAPVPFHPAWRRPERLILDPDPEAIPAPAREGERALVEALARLPDPAARWRHAVEAGREVLMDDPAFLGLDPEAVLGPGADWDAVAARAGAVRAALARKLAHVVFVGLDLPGREAMAEALDRPFPDLGELARFPAPDPAAPDPEAAVALAEALLAELPDPAARLAILAPGERAFSAVVALHAHDLLRDRTLALVSLGGPLRAGPRGDWLAARFRHEELEPELMRTIAYLSAVAVDPGDPLAGGPEAWEAQRFVEPPLPPTGRRAIEAVDLGPLALDSLDPGDIALALALLLAWRL